MRLKFTKTFSGTIGLFNKESEYNIENKALAEDMIDLGYASEVKKSSKATKSTIEKATKKVEVETR